MCSCVGFVLCTVHQLYLLLIISIIIIIIIIELRKINRKGGGKSSQAKSCLKDKNQIRSNQLNSGCV